MQGAFSASWMNLLAWLSFLCGPVNASYQVTSHMRNWSDKTISLALSVPYFDGSWWLEHSYTYELPSPDSCSVLPSASSRGLLGWVDG